MSRSSKWSKSCGFQLVAFCEQTGGQFCRFGGAPLRPPGSSPLGANRAKRFGRKLDTTVDLRIFGSVGLEGEWMPQGQSCTIRRSEARWFWGRPPSNSPGRWQSCSLAAWPRHAGRWRSFDPRLTCVAELLSEPVKRGSNLDRSSCSRRHIVPH